LLNGSETPVVSTAAHDVSETAQEPSAERDLVEACREGRGAAFEELFRAQGSRMKSIAMNLLGNPSDAEDAVQEAFLKLYRGLAGFKGESALSSWLYRILVNTCFDAIRRRKRRGEVSGPDAEGPAENLHARETDPSVRLTLERSLDRLPALPRAVFVLYEVEGFKHREIAELLGIAEGTSKHALFAAKKDLQSLILRSRRWRRES
jgi:RNA polymerase sigma-70 factor (ECF subfamily)